MRPRPRFNTYLEEDSRHISICLRGRKRDMSLLQKRGLRLLQLPADADMSASTQAYGGRFKMTHLQSPASSIRLSSFILKDESSLQDST